MLLAPMRYIVAGEVTKLIDLKVAVAYVAIVLIIKFLSKRISGASLENVINKNDCLVSKGILIYVFSLILSCMVNNNRTDILGISISVLALLPFFVFRILAKKMNVGKVFRRTLFICTAIGIAICIYEVLGLKNLRPCGLLNNANNWAAYLGFMLPISIYGFSHNSKKNRVYYLILSAFICLCLLLVKSRAMLLGLLELGILFVLSRAYKYNIKLFFMVIFSMLFFIVLNLDNIVQVLTRGYDNDRLQAYYAALQMFKDHFLFGVGYTQFQPCYASEYVPAMKVEFLPHAHSMYLQYLATTGLCGFVGGMTFICCLLKSLYLKAKHDNYFFVGIAGIAIFMLHGIFDSPISNNDFYRVFWLFVIVYNINIFQDDKS